MQKELLLGEILKRRGWLNEEQLTEALEEQQFTKDFLGAILRRKNIISEEQLTLALSEQFQIPTVDLKRSYIDWDIAFRFPNSLIVEGRCLPFHEDAMSVTVAVSNPLNVWAMSRMEEEASGKKVRFVLVTETGMKDALERYRRAVQARIHERLT